MKRFAILFLLAACTPTTAPLIEPETVIVGIDGGDPTCSGACTNLRALGCPEGNPSPGGVPCETICANAQSLIDLRCVSSAKSTAAVATCGVRCVP